jgi:hypothetical protein
MSYKGGTTHVLLVEILFEYTAESCFYARWKTMGKLLPLIGEDGTLESLAMMRAFYEYLAPKPYCTNTLGCLLIRPKAIAIRNAYIQPNPITRATGLCLILTASRAAIGGMSGKYPRRTLRYEIQRIITSICFIR